MRSAVGSTPIHSRLVYLVGQGFTTNSSLGQDLWYKSSMMNTTDQASTEILNSIVQRYLKIEDITLGDDRQGFLMRYRGMLYSDPEGTAVVYDSLTEQLKPYNITPLFRWDEKRHMVILVPGMPKPRPSNPWVNLVMFLLTLISVLFTGALYSAETDPFSGGFAIGKLLTLVVQGWPFAVSLLAILGAHEFGHYLVGRYHGVQVSLPYFIPLPILSPLGTMGAFINMKSVPKNRRDLLDIGLAGPIAGLVVAVPVLLIGLMLSKVNSLPVSIGGNLSLQLEGNSILYLLLKFLVFGQLLPSPASFGSLPPFLYWLRYFFTGTPLPLGGMDVMLHPVAWAGWAGLLVTSLNLIPAGQLDGGHALYVLLGAKGARRLLPFILGAVALLGIAWSGWWLWVVLILILGRTYAEPLDQITPLDPARKALAVFGLVMFILVFIPVPLILIAGS